MKHAVLALQVQIWKDGLSQRSSEVYMQHQIPGCPVSSARFCPYQDVLAIGHAEGLSTILVPGAGEPNFDSFVANPYQTSKQRREGEVHQVLDKLQPETIMLDPSRIGKVCCGFIVASTVRKLVVLCFTMLRHAAAAQLPGSLGEV